MEALGYKVSMQLIRASDYGVPQSRYRVLIIGVSNEMDTFDFASLQDIVRENHIPSVSFGHREKLLLGSILQDVEGKTNNESWEYTASTQHMIELIGPCDYGKQGFKYFSNGFVFDDLPQNIKEGRSWKNISPEDLPPRFKKIYDDPKKYHAPKFYRRFALGEINGTITASAQPENCGITHPFENRRYTVREIARIQSFPDEYSFSSIPLQSQYKVIGNAVPPVLAWVVAKALIRKLDSYGIHQ